MTTIARLFPDDISCLVDLISRPLSELQARCHERTAAMDRESVQLSSAFELGMQYAGEQAAHNATCDRYSELLAEFTAMPEQTDFEHVARFEVGTPQWFDAVEEVTL